VARVLCGPVLALQGLAFLLGALFDDLSVPKWEAWHRNAFVHALALLGPAGWALAALVAGAGLMAVLRAGPSATSTSTSAKDTELSAAR
jgi:TRAP-type C4-dicarboxylate transport system permease small subunit